MSTNQNAFGEAFEKPLTDDFEHATAERERIRREGLSVADLERAVDDAWAKYQADMQAAHPAFQAWCDAVRLRDKAKLRAEIMAEQTTKPTTKEV